MRTGSNDFFYVIRIHDTVFPRACIWNKNSLPDLFLNLPNNFLHFPKQPNLFFASFKILQLLLFFLLAHQNSSNLPRKEFLDFPSFHNQKIFDLHMNYFSLSSETSIFTSFSIKSVNFHYT